MGKINVYRDRDLQYVNINYNTVETHSHTGVSVGTKLPYPNSARVRGIVMLRQNVFKTG